MVNTMTPAEQDKLRLQFFREHRREPGLGSVSVRQHEGGSYYLRVGTTGGLSVESTYRGLPVEVIDVPPAVNAVAFAASPGSS